MSQSVTGIKSVKLNEHYVNNKNTFKIIKLMIKTKTNPIFLSRYRIPKTKFIYDTKIGTLHLEQKLPLSWHAFNETPKFDEIPEVRAIGELRTYFSTTNATLTSYYLDYKPYLDLKEWTPPFNTKSMIIGNKNFITFDRKHFEFQGTCSYLLAHDFIDNNFTIIASYDAKKLGKTHHLNIFIANESLIVDVFQNLISIGNSSKVRLPYASSNVYVYQDIDTLVVKSKLGVGLKCNFKFEICVLDVSGKFLSYIRTYAWSYF